MAKKRSAAKALAKPADAAAVCKTCVQLARVLKKTGSFFITTATGTPRSIGIVSPRQVIK
jgi:hypothetical protein